MHVLAPLAETLLGEHRVRAVVGIRRSFRFLAPKAVLASSKIELIEKISPSRLAENQLGGDR